MFATYHKAGLWSYPQHASTPTCQNTRGFTSQAPGREARNVGEPPPARWPFSRVRKVSGRICYQCEGWGKTSCVSQVFRDIRACFPDRNPTGVLSVGKLSPKAWLLIITGNSTLQGSRVHAPKVGSFGQVSSLTHHQKIHVGKDCKLSRCEKTFSWNARTTPSAGKMREPMWVEISFTSPQKFSGRPDVLIWGDTPPPPPGISLQVWGYFWLSKIGVATRL